MVSNQPAAITEMDRLIGWLAALAVVIHVLEAGIPSPLPGIKPGLANVVTLVVLARYGLGPAIWVAIIRVVVGSLVIGTFLTPTFILSATGAAASLLAMAAAVWIGRMIPAFSLSLIGLGVLAALAHMSTQFFVAWRLFVPHPGLLTLLPVLQAAALAFGLCTGWLAARLVDQLAPRSPVSG